MSAPTTTPWPELPYASWANTCATLHLWTQIVGKIRLACTPWLNHSWHVALYVTSRGLSTSPIPYGERTFELIFDFNSHVLRIEVSDGASRRIALEPRTVADFYHTLLAELGALQLAVRINDYPAEIAGALRFSEDRTHAAYDCDLALRFWQILVQADRVFKQFRTGFLGKASPVHFFWGSFDLAVTRFSGRRAPPFSGKVPGLSTAVMREAYSHEVSSAGFWPGGHGIDFPAFYSYAYPTPEGFKDWPVLPKGATFSTALGEFLLPYDVVRLAPDPDGALLSFLQSTYEAAAQSAKWDRGALDCGLGECGIPRPS